MKKILMILFILPLAFYAQNNDTGKVYILDEIKVLSERVYLPEYVYPADKDNLGSILNRNGFGIIRKGAFFANDIYLDGFKRGDINVVIDGEEYHSACPNRMDSPLTRVNPLDIESVDLIKSSAVSQAGIAGKIEFHRSRPATPFLVKGSITGTTVSGNGIEAAVSAETHKQRISVRYSNGLPYQDADDRKFTDLYNYKDNYRYQLGEAAYYGIAADWEYGASFSYAENISFPYLMMDEKYNRVFSGFASYKSHKFYFNYTNHLMDNTLRTSPMLMETDAKNFTAGVKSDFYDVSYRNWKAENKIIMMAMPINNNAIPEVQNIAASLNHSIATGDWHFTGNAGVEYFTAGSDNIGSFYSDRSLSNTTSRVFPVFALSAAYNKTVFNDAALGIVAEVNSVAPGIEEMFIAIERPANSFDWSGNPDLNQPLKTGLRASMVYSGFTFELYGNYVMNYVYLNRLMLNKPVMSYNNIDVLIAGVNLNYSSRYYDGELLYTYGEKTKDNTPLAEIRPLTITNTVKLPEFYGVNIYVRHTYNNAQKRTDTYIGESASATYNRFDVGAGYTYNNILFSIEAENITNELYYNYLSYLRNPYSSGAKVIEPGVLLRANIKFQI